MGGQKWGLGRRDGIFGPWSRGSSIFCEIVMIFRKNQNKADVESIIQGK